MKRYAKLLVHMLFPLVLTGCFGVHALTEEDCLESWRQYIERCPSKWLCGADRWFLRCEPNDEELANRRAPQGSMKSRSIKPPAFTQVKVDGDFQVQLIGGPKNRLCIYGPKSAVRAITIFVKDHTLYLQQNAEIPRALMHRVIIRVSIKCLSHLIQIGAGSIEAIRLHSNSLRITTNGTGELFLSGPINISRVEQLRGGCITLLDVNACGLVIRSLGSGLINIAGPVCLDSITHRGTGNINIIGARSNGLCLYTQGYGKIGICGQISLSSLTAKGHTCVFITNLVPPPCPRDAARMYLMDYARVGVAGSTPTLAVNLCDRAFFAGRNVCTQTALIKAYDCTHANVTANRRAFISSAGDSHVYFFGPSNLLTAFSSGTSTIIPTEERNWCNYQSEYRPYAYTYARDNITYVPKIKCL